MRNLSIISLALMFLVAFPSWGLTMDDLVFRDGLYFKKFSDIPFTGELDEGLDRGSFENGKKNGSWESYFTNGQLDQKGTFQNGKKEGLWKGYHPPHGNLWYRGAHRDGKREGFWEMYHPNTQLYFKGEYKAGKKQGFWEVYYANGAPNKDDAGTFANGVKVGD